MHARQVSARKPLACSAEDLLGCCCTKFSNLAHTSWPVYFLWWVAMLLAPIASQQWAQHQNGNQKAERHRGIETDSDGAGPPLYLGFTGVWLFWLRQSPRGLDKRAMEWQVSSSAVLVCHSWCLKTMQTWVAHISIFVKKITWPALKKHHPLHLHFPITHPQDFKPRALTPTSVSSDFIICFITADLWK